MSYRLVTKLTVVTYLLYYQTGRYLIQHKLCHIDWYKAYGGNLPTILSNRKIFDTAQTMSYRLYKAYGGNLPTILSSRNIFDTAQTMSCRLIQSLRW